FVGRQFGRLLRCEVGREAVGGQRVGILDVGANGCRDIRLLLTQVVGVALHGLTARVELLAFWRGRGCEAPNATVVGGGRLVDHGDDVTPRSEGGLAR